MEIISLIRPQTNHNLLIVAFLYISVDLQKLKRGEFHKFKQIDRREIIKQIYYHREGSLVLEEEYYDVPEWTTKEKEGFIDTFVELDSRGGYVYGVYEDGTIVAMGTLDVKFIGRHNDQLQLAGLWVSIQSRGKGIASKLVNHMKTKAKELGAKKLYVSATPSFHTVEFYKHKGFIITSDIDKKLFDKEPEDIHMECLI